MDEGIPDFPYRDPCSSPEPQHHTRIPVPFQDHCPMPGSLSHTGILVPCLSHSIIPYGDSCPILECQDPSPVQEPHSHARILVRIPVPRWDPCSTLKSQSHSVIPALCLAPQSHSKFCVPFQDPWPRQGSQSYTRRPVAHWDPIPTPGSQSHAEIPFPRQLPHLSRALRLILLYFQSGISEKHTGKRKFRTLHLRFVLNENIGIFHFQVRFSGRAES